MELPAKCEGLQLACDAICSSVRGSQQCARIQSAASVSLSRIGDVAISGNFGYELDLTKFTDEEKEIVKLQVETYKQIRSLVQKGDLYRLKSNFEGNESAWMFISEDKQEALVYYFQVMAVPNTPRRTL